MNNSTEQAFVSVLMTAFNREKYIGEAINSVLESTFKNFELIIVDDCSTDSTVEIARKYEMLDTRVKVYVNKKNLGDYPNRNKAASYAKGKYLKFLDSDDLIYSHSLQVMIDAMIKFPDAAFGLSSSPQNNEPYPIIVSPENAYRQHFNGFGHFNRAPGSSIIKREIFKYEKGFNETKHISDTEFWFRLARKYNLVLFQRDLVWDRCHEETESAYEKKDLRIVKTRRELVRMQLLDKDCPLNEKEINKIRNQINYNSLKSIIRDGIKFQR